MTPMDSKDQKLLILAILTSTKLTISLRTSFPETGFNMMMMIFSVASLGKERMGKEEDLEDSDILDLQCLVMMTSLVDSAHLHLAPVVLEEIQEELPSQ